VLEWRYTTSVLCEWQVDGISQPTLAVSSGFVSQIHVGWALTAATATVDYDDLCISATAGDYPMGATKVLLLTPAGTAAVNTPTAFSLMSANGTINSTFNVTTARDAVAEVPPSIGASADGFVQDATDTAAHVDIPMSTYTLAGGEAIIGVRVVCCGWAVSTTAATLGFRAYNGTVEEVLQVGTVNPTFSNSATTPGWFAKQCTLTNFDTQAKLDALQVRVGWSSDAAPDIGVQAVYAEVAVAATQQQPAGTPGWWSRPHRSAHALSAHQAPG